MKDLFSAMVVVDALIDLWALRATDGAGSGKPKDKGKKRNDHKS